MYIYIHTHITRVCTLTLRLDVVVLQLTFSERNSLAHFGESQFEPIAVCVSACVYSLACASRLMVNLRVARFWMCQVDLAGQGSLQCSSRQQLYACTSVR